MPFILFIIVKIVYWAYTIHSNFFFFTPLIVYICIEFNGKSKTVKKCNNNYNMFTYCIVIFVNINWLLTFCMCIFMYYIVVMYTFLFWRYKIRIVYSPCSIRIWILFCRITFSKRIHFIWYKSVLFLYFCLI